MHFAYVTLYFPFNSPSLWLLHRPLGFTFVEMFPGFACSKPRTSFSSSPDISFSWHQSPILNHFSSFCKVSLVVQKCIIMIINVISGFLNLKSPRKCLQSDSNVLSWCFKYSTFVSSLMGFEISICHANNFFNGLSLLGNVSVPSKHENC